MDGRWPAQRPTVQALIASTAAIVSPPLASKQLVSAALASTAFAMVTRWSLTCNPLALSSG